MLDAFVWARENDLSLASKLRGLAVFVTGFTKWRQEVTVCMLSLLPRLHQA